MFPRRERQVCLRLAAAEVQMIEIVWNGLIERRQFGVDQQMMVTRVFAVRPSGSDAHVPETEMDPELALNGRAVLDIDEIDFGSRRRGREASGVWRRRRGRRCRRRFAGNTNLDARRHDRGIVGNVILVPEKQLQRVFARSERQFRFGLACPEMQMVEIVRNGLIERRQIGVDQQVVMPRVLAVRSRGRDTHAI